MAVLGGAALMVWYHHVKEISSCAGLCVIVKQHTGRQSGEPIKFEGIKESMSCVRARNDRAIDAEAPTE
jgi:hypothetical protein